MKEERFRTMRFVFTLVLLLLIVPAGALCQERVSNTTVGPNGDQIRIVVALVETSQEGYSLQSMIIDVKLEKGSKNQPSYFHVDLTTTVRALSTGKKKQEILLLRWKKSGEIETKCDGKWVKQDAGSSLEKVVDATKAVIQSVPLDKKVPTEVVLPPDVEQKIAPVLDAVSNQEFPCVRKLV